MIRGKYFVFFIVALAVALTALLVIFKPGPMSARRVAYLKQVELFGSEPNFKISQAEIDTMPVKQLDSAIVLFNHILRADDTLDLIATYMSSDVTFLPDSSESTVEVKQSPQKAIAYSHSDMYRMQNRKKVMLAYLDLMSGKLHNQNLVDSLAVLALEPNPTMAQDDEFERLHSELYGGKQ